MKKIVTLILLAATACLVQCENENSPKKNKKHQPFPPGGFSITNSNSQNFNLEETRREVTISSQHPAVVIHTPHQQPQQPYQPQYTQRNEHTNQPSYVVQHDHSRLQQETRDYFRPYYTKIKEIPSLFTAKNCLIALGAVACGYGVIYALLMHHVKNAQKSTGWGSFQEHIPPADLNSIDPLALADGIIEEIKARYPLINPANLMPSILLFNKDIEEELDELNNFINFYAGIITYKLITLFPNQEKLMAKALIKIQRLHIVHDAITEWINTHVTRLMRNEFIPRQTAVNTRANENEVGTKNAVPA